MAASKHYVSNLRFAVLKAESTQGTMVTPADADFDSRFYGAELTLNLPVDDENSKFGTGDHGEDEAIPAEKTASVVLRTKLHYGGAVTTEPNNWKLLKACGLVLETYAGTGLGLKPLAAGDDVTYTCWVFDVIRGGTPTGKIYKLAGCMGDGAIYADAIGRPWMAEATLQGRLVDIIDCVNGDILALTSPDTALPITMCANTVSMQGAAKKISSFRLNFGNDVQPQYNQAVSGCVDFFGIVARRPRLQMNPLMVTDSGDDDSEDTYNNFVTMDATAGSIASSSGNTTIHVPRPQILTLAQASREGLVNYDINYKLLRNGTVDANLPEEATFEVLQGARA